MRADHRESTGRKTADRKAAGSASPFPYARMAERQDALDRLELQFRWGDYGIRVLRCHLASFPPGHIIHFHKHSGYEFHYIPKGKGKVILINQAYDLHEGMFYLTGPDLVHYQESDPEDPMYELCLHLEIEPLTAAAEPSGWGEELEAAEAKECITSLDRLPIAPVVDRFHAMSGFLEAYRILEEQPIGFYTLLKQEIVQILLRTVRVLDRADDRTGIPQRDMSFHRYKLATQYIQDNESMPISLEQVAEAIGTSPRQLQRIFRSEGRTTFRDYLEHTRLTAICSDLILTDKAIEEIALAHGYANPNYLYPVFKSKYEVTPSAYRKMHAGEHSAPYSKREKEASI
ncbi:MULTISPECIES: AraC family transcriptional regulator [Paenibacillus]|uniref:AraC family transcriptional regulator n=1 Tax=Paenibacillus TaxID=44249 RepID=UPI00073E4FEE|nr:MULTISPECIES: AraC family transcriptional regulator [Paenibacillus]MDU4695029.1 AraC family transcriptional regulator [Paenibacillus sp.]